jgi:hypothetical protein
MDILKALHLNSPKPVPAPAQAAKKPSSPLNARFQDLPELRDVAAGKGSLGLKSKGEAVKRLQTALTDMGFYCGDQADGAYGPQTATAVENFQSSCKLPVNGKMDQKTLLQLSQQAPQPGKKLWSDTHTDQRLPSNELGKLGKAKAVIDLSEHRLFLYDSHNAVKKVYSIAAGDPNHPDGKGQKTGTGIRKVLEKIDDPAPIAMQAWPESQGRAFGKRLLDLGAYDPQQGRWQDTTEELHGTYVSSSIGTDASHGCMRLQNEDIQEVYDQLRVGDLIKIQD